MSKPLAHLRERLYVPAKHVPDGAKLLFTYPWKNENPFDWAKDQADIIYTYRITSDRKWLAFNRGDIVKIEDIFGDAFEIVDERAAPSLGFDLKMVDNRGDVRAEFAYRSGQYDALCAACDPNIGGIIKAPPAFGKTVLVCAYIAAQNMRALFIADQTNLLEQFHEEMLQFTNIDDFKDPHSGELPLGPLDQEREKPFPISYTTYHYLFHHHDYLLKIQNEFGVVVVDEVHTVAARLFSRVVTSLNPLLRLGVSATPTRKDGLHILFDDLIGPLRYEQQRTAKTRCYVINTGVKLCSGMSNFVNIVNALSRSKERDDMIAKETKEAIFRGHKVIILVGRQKHAYRLAKRMREKWSIRAEGISGQDKGKAGTEKRKQIKEDITNDKLDCIVATHNLFGKGFNLPVLSHLGIAVPTASPENFEQWIGRIEREVDGKMQPEVYYYNDRGPGVLYGCAKVIRKTCMKLGLPVETIFKYHRDETDESITEALGLFKRRATTKPPPDNPGNHNRPSLCNALLGNADQEGSDYGERAFQIQG